LPKQKSLFGLAGSALVMHCTGAASSLAETHWAEQKVEQTGC
jgi:hypothetical protein